MSKNFIALAELIENSNKAQAKMDSLKTNSKEYHAALIEKIGFDRKIDDLMPDYGLSVEEIENLRRKGCQAFNKWHLNL